ncbi:hypothetical protein QA641_35920 [Bradyrhizobium sp. CB1650]|uniref:hypothetical protein n=1 Tax=Bradyrhizobium sp. CB1650 TaxID=3039153 RepID=UPI002435B231|nr:hypothetical protein [Bradyrhizobium sp. CB1650]WGD50918.1 hypothetical protein QA641_35920 [Bradyrhizobium sp. CB1650]
MFQYSDQDCCSRARKYCRRECASFLRDFKEPAPPALAFTKAIRAEHAAERQLFYRREPVAARVASVRTHGEARCAQRRESMMSWLTIETQGSIAVLEHIIRKFRELIDTDSSIPPELRGALHATLDKHLLEARKRFLL